MNSSVPVGAGTEAASSFAPAALCEETSVKMSEGRKLRSNDHSMHTPHHPHLPRRRVGDRSEAPGDPVAQRDPAHAAAVQMRGECGYGRRDAHSEAAGGGVWVALVVGWVDG